MIMDFITGLAWAFGVFFTLIYVVNFISAFNYIESLNHKLDRVKGTERKYKHGKYGIIAIICWVWVFTV